MSHQASQRNTAGGLGDHDHHAMADAPAGLEENGLCATMHVERRIGHDHLTPFTHRWEHRAGAQAVRILPDNQSDFIVDSHGHAWLVGPATGVDMPRLTHGTVLRGLRIDTAWLRHIAGVDAKLLTDQEVALDALFPAGVSRLLADSLWERRFTRELAESLWPDAAVDARVVGAVAALTARDGPTVSGLAVKMGVSERHLRRMVERDTGLSPKTIQRVARVRRAIADAAAHTGGLADVAAAHGYSDQAHFAREVRHFSGVTLGTLTGPGARG